MHYKARTSIFDGLGGGGFPHANIFFNMRLLQQTIFFCVSVFLQTIFFNCIQFISVFIASANNFSKTDFPTSPLPPTKK